MGTGCLHYSEGKIGPVGGDSVDGFAADVFLGAPRLPGARKSVGHERHLATCLLKRQAPAAVICASVMLPINGAEKGREARLRPAGSPVANGRLQP